MMKSEPKAFASLSSGLLARKGTARPAMRPQGFGQGGSGLEDLGWNDMGFEPPRAVLTPVPASEDEGAQVARPTPVTGLTPSSPVHAVQDELVQRLAYEPVVNEDEADETAEPVPEDTPPLHVLLAQKVRAPVAGEAVSEPVAIVPAPVAIVAAPAPVMAEIAPRPVEVEVVAEVAAAPQTRKAVGPAPRAMPGAKSKAAFTLRLDSARHLKLRLACAVTGVSAQQLVTRALDALLTSMPELETMANNAPEQRSSKG